MNKHLKRLLTGLLVIVLLGVINVVCYFLGYAIISLKQYLIISVITMFGIVIVMAVLYGLGVLVDSIKESLN